QFASRPEPLQPASEARVELLKLAPDGRLVWRRTLPVREKIGIEGFAISSLGVVIAGNGELAVVWSANDPDMSRGPRRRFATLLRLDADGNVKSDSAIGPPSPAHGRNDPHGYYELYVYQAAAPDALLLGGGFGSGPYAWWMGKFGLDGRRLWQAGPGTGFPERVAAAGARPDGSWLSLVTEQPRDGGLAWFIRRYAADGRLLARTRLPQPVENEATVLRHGCALVTSADMLDFVDDTGRLLRRAPWPFAQTLRLMADGDGIAAIVEASADMRRVVRADALGAIRWRSATADATDIAPTPDGQLAALVRSGKDGETLRLVRYADP
ncbi:hypothetical protein, partial [Vineibacter terrae]|uniref:hypothetical protein n=1 Tax=Vineibacter terrae TaxID=2586908 RepID=UPI002E349186